MREKDPSQQSRYPGVPRFGLAAGSVLLLFIALILPSFWGFAVPVWALVTLGVLTTLLLLLPSSLGAAVRIWVHLIELSGGLLARLLLCLLFFCVFVPVGAAMRLFRDPMQRVRDRSAVSYRKLSRTPKPENMGRTF